MLSIISKDYFEIKFQVSEKENNQPYIMKYTPVLAKSRQVLWEDLFHTKGPKI